MNASTNFCQFSISCHDPSFLMVGSSELLWFSVANFSKMFQFCFGTKWRSFRKTKVQSPSYCGSHFRAINIRENKEFMFPAQLDLLIWCIFPDKESFCLFPRPFFFFNCRKDLSLRSPSYVNETVWHLLISYKFPCGLKKAFLRYFTCSFYLFVN